MKLLISVLIALTFAVVLALVAKEDAGYVMLAYGNWSIEMSAIMLGILFTAAFSVLYYSARFLVGIKQIPGRTKSWRENRKHIKGNEGLTRGLLELMEGRPGKAEKILLRNADNSHAPLLNYLGAARAAQQMSEYKKRDAYLNNALNVFPKERIAIDITRAELQLEQGKYKQALTSIRQLRQHAPNNHHVISLLAKAYKELNDWENLKDLLVVIRKQNVMGDDELYPLTIECHYQLLMMAGKTDNTSTALAKAWLEIPKMHRSYKKLLLTYCQLVIDTDSDDSVESLLRDGINKSWDSDFVYLYGKADYSNSARQLACAEKWLESHDKDSVLLLALGRLCLRNQLWGKARDYLCLSISNGNSAEACYMLGKLLERMGEPDSATELYEKGLSMSVDTSFIELPKLPMLEEPDSTRRLTVISS